MNPERINQARRDFARYRFQMRESWVEILDGLIEYTAEVGKLCSAGFMVDGRARSTICEQAQTCAIEYAVAAWDTWEARQEPILTQ
jgi:hypothetical protein